MNTHRRRRKIPVAEIYANILCAILAVAFIYAMAWVIVEHSLPIMGYK